MKKILLTMFLIYTASLFSMEFVIRDRNRVKGELIKSDKTYYYISSSDKLYKVKRSDVLYVYNDDKSMNTYVMNNNKDNKIKYEDFEKVIAYSPGQDIKKKEEKKSYLADSSLQIKAFADIDSKIDASGGLEKSSDVGTGFSFSADYFYPINSFMQAGVGASYAVKRKLDDDTDGKFNFIPVYASLKLTLPDNRERNIVPGAVFHAGYNFLMGDKSFENYFITSDLKGSSGSENKSSSVDFNGGLYIAGGVNFEINKKFVIELLYKKHFGEAELSGISDDKIDVDYSTISIGMGINFR